MHILNPTDDEVNSLFLRHIAKGQLTPDDLWNQRAILSVAKTHTNPNARSLFTPAYIHNANAVLPWLKDSNVSIHNPQGKGWSVSVNGYLWFSTSFARSATIAMLACAGITIEYSP